MLLGLHALLETLWADGVVIHQGRNERSYLRSRTKTIFVDVLRELRLHSTTLYPRSEVEA